MWTHFWDTSNGKRKKLKWKHIYIEAPEYEAKAAFCHLFGSGSSWAKRACWAEGYSVISGEDLAQLSGYHRGCAHVYEIGDTKIAGEELDDMNSEDWARTPSSLKYLEKPRPGLTRCVPLQEYFAQEWVKVVPSEKRPNLAAFTGRTRNRPRLPIRK